MYVRQPKRKWIKTMEQEERHIIGQLRKIQAEDFKKRMLAAIEKGLKEAGAEKAKVDIDLMDFFEDQK